MPLNRKEALEFGMARSFSILHLSDLHRDIKNEVSNLSLITSLLRDRNQHQLELPAIPPPDLCIVSGDLIYGAAPKRVDAETELARQYDQTKEFLIALADNFFSGDRSRIVLIPGNHDIAYCTVANSLTKIEIPDDSKSKGELVAEFFSPRTQLRWSWSELCFYRIKDEEKYGSSLGAFASMYEGFYQGARKFSVEPSDQYDVFDFPDLEFSIAALNSCYRNDPLNRTASFHPEALIKVCEKLRAPERSGWLLGATWHHSVLGAPQETDYLDSGFLQLLIETGVSLGFHGHQHYPECVDERHRIGLDNRKISLVSAGTLCAGPGYLPTGINRGYNIVQVIPEEASVTVHQRQMVSGMDLIPLWGPGHFISTQKSSITFDIAPPLKSRPKDLDIQLTLLNADALIGAKQWKQAYELLAPRATDTNIQVRLYLTRALEELADPLLTIQTLVEPRTNHEAVVIAGAILEAKSQSYASSFLSLSFVKDTTDPSVLSMVQRIKERFRI